MHPLHASTRQTPTALCTDKQTHTCMCRHTHSLLTLLAEADTQKGRQAGSLLKAACTVHFCTLLVHSFLYTRVHSWQVTDFVLPCLLPVPAHLRRVEERAMGSGTRVADTPALPPALTPEPASATAGRLSPLTPSNMAPTAATTMRGSSTAGGGGYGSSSSVLAPVTAGRASNMRTIPEGEP